MINKAGEKIIAQKDAYNEEFALKEISFFMKGFRNGTSDTKAWSVAKMITEYLKNNGRSALIFDYLEELEAYSKDSKSDDFLWELVYILRIYVTRYVDRREYKCAYGYKIRAARIFEDICRLVPSWHNKRIRVYEYSLASLYLLDYRDFWEVEDKIKDCINRALEHLLELEPKDQNNYYDTARLTYVCKRFYMQTAKLDKGDEWLDCLRKMTYYAREEYGTDKTDTDYLDWVISYYEFAGKYKEFICREEIENINTIYQWVKESLDPTQMMVKLGYISKLKALRDHFSAQLAD